MHLSVKYPAGNLTKFRISAFLSEILLRGEWLLFE